MNKHRPFVLSLLCLIATSLILGAEDNDHSILKNLDVFELEAAVDPQVSPDGTQVVYVRQSNDIMSDRARRNIWIVNSDGTDHRPLLSGNQNFSSPRWSPSGDRLAYVSAVEGKGQQLHVRWMDTGQTALLSNLQKSPGSIAWSPDGKQIAFSMFVEEEGPKLASPPKKPKGAEWAPPVKVIDAVRYRADGGGFLEVGHSHLFVIPSEGGTPRQLTEGSFNHSGPISWSADGVSLIFSANRSEGWEYDPLRTNIWSVDVGSGELTALTEGSDPKSAPVFSPDSSKIAYLVTDGDDVVVGHNRVAVMNADGTGAKVLAADLDRSIDGVQWLGDSKTLLVYYDDRGIKKLARLSLNGGMTVLPDGFSTTSTGRPYSSGGNVSTGPDGSYAYTTGSAIRPPDIAIVRPGKDPVQLTYLNEDALGHKSLGEVEELTWMSSAGDNEIQGWIVKPPNFDPSEKYPLILEIHGGPFMAYGPSFSSEFQLYAAAGYVVFYCNPRGSTSYGVDFTREILHNYPSKDYDDLISGVDAVLAKGYIDESHLYVTGGSGGGVLTAWIVGKTDRFRAAVVGKPVINWVSHTLTADAAWYFTQYWFPGYPWEEHEHYWKYSPLSLVGNVSTPTMLLTGEEDFRTPMGESEQYYQALKMRKIDTALVRVPEASHGIANRPSHLIAKVDNILAWFKKYSDDVDHETKED